ncbi:MAG: hypothetical protein KGI91_14685 [Burkholderiales bacterium]|nr:hypothetical protein [Burkholderiales bacterium]
MLKSSLSRREGVWALACLATACPWAAHAQQASFNPNVSVILSGTYTNLSKDPNTWRIKGFVPSGSEIGPGPRGYNLGESELGLNANVDPYFYGNVILSVANDNTISAEEAYIQTTALPNGWTIKGGRFYSGLGYLNAQHSHTWDFADAPLVYQAMLGGQFKQNGLQLSWLAPTDQYLEFGAESGNGANFPGTQRNKNSAGATALFVHTGGDVGDSNSWRAGVSWLNTHAQDRTWSDVQDASITNAFTGQSKIWAADGVWKWAPHGNAIQTNFKLQGEYFHRTENGNATYDLKGVGANTDAYRSAQSGWYMQGIYQFMPRWRVGLRYDQLHSGHTQVGTNLALAEQNVSPKRSSVMVDWSLSEFSRIRVQLSDDKARVDQSDRQLFVQYQMSLGAHGAHSY